jgi:hypothetical protein
MVLYSCSIEAWLATLIKAKRVSDRTTRNLTTADAKEKREAEDKSRN